MSRTPGPHSRPSFSPPRHAWSACPTGQTVSEWPSARIRPAASSARARQRGSRSAGCGRNWPPAKVLHWRPSAGRRVANRSTQRFTAARSSLGDSHSTNSRKNPINSTLVVRGSRQGSGPSAAIIAGSHGSPGHHRNPRHSAAPLSRFCWSTASSSWRPTASSASRTSPPTSRSSRATFPDFPVMPGVLIVEAMAQVAGVLVLKDMPDRQKKLVLLASIEEAKFRQPVLPGDQLRIEMKILKRKASVVQDVGQGDRGRRGRGRSQVMCKLADRAEAGLAALPEAPCRFIRPRSSIRQARIHPDADIGPYCIIGAEVEIGARTRLMAHMYMRGPPPSARTTSSIPTPPSASPRRT